MNQASGSAPSGSRDPAEDGGDARGGDSKTPSTDMQPEDAGTAESGDSGHGTAAEGAMKQTSKTANETGAKR